MKLGTPCCPECGERASQIEETMLCNYEIGEMEEGEAGEFDYTGEYKDFSDTAQPHIVEGTVQVECDEGHTWRTTVETGSEQPGITLTPEAKAWALLTAHKMALRWSYHKDAWVASMLHVETGNECQFVSVSPEGAIAGAHKKATTPKVKK